MIASLYELLVTGWVLVLIAAWRAVPLIAIVLLVEWAFGRRIPARAHCWLWMLVMVRMLLPVSIAAPISVAGVMDRALDGLLKPSAHHQPDRYGLAAGSTSGSEWVRADSHIWHSAYQLRTKASDLAVANIARPRFVPTSSLAPRPTADSGIDWLLIAGYLAVGTWCVVALMLLLRSLVAYARLALRLRHCRDVQDEPVIAELDNVCRELALSHRPQLKIVEAITVPATFGVWSPVLCWPSHALDDLSAAELNWVLRHELAHVQRRDALKLCCASVVKALHWFNPLAWLVESKLKAYVELAADELATRKLAPSSRNAYAELLVRYASANSSAYRGNATGLLAMASIHGLKRRIQSLTIPDRRLTWRGKVLVLALLLSLGVTCLTDAMTTKVKPLRSPERSSLQVALEEAVLAHSVPAAEEEEVKTLVSLDMQTAMAKAEQLQPGVDAERFLSTYLLGPDAREATIVDGTLKVKLTETKAHFCRHLLQAFERGGAPQIAVEFRILEADIAYGRSFDWQTCSTESQILETHGLSSKQLDSRDLHELLDGLDATQPPQAFEATTSMRPMLTAKLSDAQIRSLIQQSQNDATSRILQAPKVTLFNGMAASVCSLTQRPFVTNYELAPTVAGAPLRPTIEVIDEGWTMGVRVVATDERKIELACIISESEIEDVQMAKLPIRASQDSPGVVTVQVPSVHRKSVATQLQLAESESLLMLSPKSYRDEQDETKSLAVFYLITPRLIPDSDFLAGFVKSAR